MGLELNAPVQFTPAGGKKLAGNAKVLIETDELIVRGDVRAKFPRASIREAKVRNGAVTVISDVGVLTISLGAAAEKFLKKLVEPPKSRIDKMGIGPNARVVIVNFPDRAFRTELTALGPGVVAARAGKNEELIVLGVEKASDLARITAAEKSLAPNGALWVIHPKGVSGVRDTDIFAEAKRNGLTYVKVARFSDTHTAEKLVRPKAARK